ncbi:MAG: hypothetical protein HY078_13720 [Elusimicrobia bacterium]|nr:hypothetical protein [Elusimicrobiota bacterium]
MESDSRPDSTEHQGQRSLAAAAVLRLPPLVQGGDRRFVLALGFAAGLLIGFGVAYRDPLIAALAALSSVDGSWWGDPAAKLSKAAAAFKAKSAEASARRSSAAATTARARPHSSRRAGDPVETARVLDATQRPLPLSMPDGVLTPHGDEAATAMAYLVPKGEIKEDARSARTTSPRRKSSIRVASPGEEPAGARYGDESTPSRAPARSEFAEGGVLRSPPRSLASRDVMHPIARAKVPALEGEPLKLEKDQVVEALREGIKKGASAEEIKAFLGRHQDAHFTAADVVGLMAAASYHSPSPRDSYDALLTGTRLPPAAVAARLRDPEARRAFNPGTVGGAGAAVADLGNRDRETVKADANNRREADGEHPRE